MINSKRKGTNGERELAKLLTGKVRYLVQRNLDQTRDGGTDIFVGPYCIEVKRARSITEAMKARWWMQAKDRARTGIPVLAFRADREDWRVRLPISHLSPEIDIDATADIAIDVFIYVVEIGSNMHEYTGAADEREASHTA